MSYTAPTISASGLTFSQLQNLRPQGHLEALIAANSPSPFQAAAARAIVAAAPFQDFVGLIREYLRGAPMTNADANQRLLDYAVAFSLIATLLNEEGVLIANNTGTVGLVAGSNQQVRTFP